MSALQATQADGFYYPPGWDPTKGSLDKFHGSHGKLGSRARKQHLGILVVRIEMPYNAWCKHCGVHIGRGVRYNAEKSKVGMYHTTTILDFKFRCAACSGELHFRTDPENRGYAAGDGLRWQAKHEIARKDEQEVELMSHDEKLALASDGMVALEHAQRDEAAAAAQAQAIEALMHSQQRAKHDYDANAQLRAGMRGRRRLDLALRRETAARGFVHKLLPVSAADEVAAHTAMRTKVLPVHRTAKSVSPLSLASVPHGTAVGGKAGAPKVRIRKRPRSPKDAKSSLDAAPSTQTAVDYAGESAVPIGRLSKAPRPAPPAFDAPAQAPPAAGSGLVDYDSDT